MAPTIMGRLTDKALQDLGSELAASHLRSEYLGYISIYVFFNAFVFCCSVSFDSVLFRALRLRYLRECLMDDRNSVTITLRGGLVEAALVWLQDGKKSSVLAAASKQGSGHIKDCVAGLEVPWPFLCRLSFLSLFFCAFTPSDLCP